MLSTLLLLSFHIVSQASATEPLPDPGMFTCGAVTAVATHADDLPSPSGCSESWSTATVGNAEFFYELNQAVDLTTLKNGTDILALAKRHHIAIPSGMTTASIDLTSSSASKLSTKLGSLAMEVPDECGGADDPLDLKIVCITVRINGRNFEICLECSINWRDATLSGCMITLTAV